MTVLSCRIQPDALYLEQFDRETCNRNVDRGIDIDELPIADIGNVHDYRLSGSCNKNDVEIKVFVEGRMLDNEVICHRGKWEISVDIAGAVSQRESFQVAISQGGGGGRVCEEVENYFICPDNYVGISNVVGASSDSFCVMKFEARFESGEEFENPFDRKGLRLRASARPNGSIITDVSINNAIKYCKENGIGYNLLTNDEWQIIARSIELEDSNWFEKESGVRALNYLNFGNVFGSIQTDGDTSDERGIWSKETRFHRLLNGSMIWDFSGNVWEIVSHNIKLSDDYEGYIYRLPSSMKHIFGPEKNYRSLDSISELRNYGVGLGYASLEGGSIILRGGSFRSYEMNAGIFSVMSTSSTNEERSDVGFRCTYRP